MRSYERRKCTHLHKLTRIVVVHVEHPEDDRDNLEQVEGVQHLLHEELVVRRHWHVNAVGSVQLQPAGGQGSGVRGHSSHCLPVPVHGATEAGDHVMHFTAGDSPRVPRQQKKLVPRGTVHVPGGVVTSGCGHDEDNRLYLRYL